MDQISLSEVLRLVQIVVEQADRLDLTIPDAIDRLELTLGYTLAPAEPPRDARSIARAVLLVRKRRSTVFEFSLFRDPAWDILLDLYANGDEKGLMISTLCYGTGVPPTTALRYVHKLAEAGFVICEEDPSDLRRTIVRMSAQTTEQIEDTLSFLRF